MKLPTSERARITETRRAGQQDTTAGRQALALAPRAYGIELADRAGQPRYAGPQDISAGTRAMSMCPPAGGILVDRGLTGAAAARPGAGALQRKPEPFPGHRGAARASRANETGLPARLKTGVESLSGLSMNDVRVHRESARPAPIQALAYTQGTEIHIAPGQEQHLPHEAWHVVQQKQGRVEPTMELRGKAINDDAALEREADVMGARAARWLSPEWQTHDTAQAPPTPPGAGAGGASRSAPRPVLQAVWNHAGGDADEIQHINHLDDKAPLVQAFGEAPDLEGKRLYLAKLLITSAQQYGDDQIRDVWRNMEEDQLNARYYEEYMLRQNGWGGEQEAHLIASHYGFSLEIQVGGRRWAIGAGQAINNLRLAWVNENHYVVVNTAGGVVHDPVGRADFVSGDCLFYSLAYIFHDADAVNHPASDANQVAVLRARANQEMQANGGADAARQGAELLDAVMADAGYDVAEFLNAQLSLMNADWKKGGTWKTLKEESATLAHSQRFGIEVEFNFAKIPYDLTKDFKAFAIAYGHLGIMRHETLPIDMHLDHADPKNAKIELVSDPLPLADFVKTLNGLKTMMGKKPRLAGFKWIQRSDQNLNMADIEKAFVGYQGFGPLSFKDSEQPVQVTTTHTAKELQSIMKAVPYQQYPSQPLKWDNNYTESISLRSLYDKGQLTQENIIKWLGRVKPVKDRMPDSFPVKGSDVLVKHAQEQFTAAPKDRRAKIADDTPADRIFHLKSKKGKDAVLRKDQALLNQLTQLNELHVLANKMAPVFKRASGDIAFVMEYRTNSFLATTARDFLIGKISESDFTKLLGKYNPK